MLCFLKCADKETWDFEISAETHGAIGWGPVIDLSHKGAALD